MKKLLFLCIAGTVTLSAQPAFAAGYIVETIKAHIDQNQTRPQPGDQRQVTSTPQTALDLWVRSLIESVSRAK